MILSQSDFDAIISGRHNHPHQVLGMHPCVIDGRQGLGVCAFLPDTSAVEVVDVADETLRYPMGRLTEDGFFECFIEGRERFAYHLRAHRHNGEIRRFHDAYSMWPTLGEQDVYLFNEGNEHFIYRKLGAHPHEQNGVRGVAFAVWAPSARRVAVIGEFNHWDGRYNPMRMLGSSGVWELFVPGLEEGQKYKFEILDSSGHLNQKTDPYGTFFESPPYNSAIIHRVDQYAWNDDEWMERRAKTDWKREPMAIYEVHLGSWKRIVEDGDRPYTYRELAVHLTDYVKDMGYTHVEFMPLNEHPFSGSWGYQVTGFFAPTHRYGKPEDLMYLIDVLHQNGIGVIIDWVPGHFPKDSWALARFDGTCLYEHADPRQGEHRDWGTLIFNYGRNEVRCFLYASALAWLDRYHVDGLRVDAVASMLYLDYSREDGDWIPNRYGGRENLEAIDFLRQTNTLVHHYYPGAIMIAEESTAWGGVSKPVSHGGLGFDFKWNMGWMHDTLEYFRKDPIHRKWHHNMLSFGMLYQYSENFINVFSHDEVVHGKGSLLMVMGAGPISEKARTLRCLYAYMWTWPGKNCLFMGLDFGQSEEWRYDHSLDWHLLQYTDHEGVQRTVRDLNLLYRQNPSMGRYDLEQRGFEWINCNDGENSVLSYVRMGDKPEETLLVVGNFTPVDRGPYRVGVPFSGYWKEIFNTNAEIYGGTGLGNFGGLESIAEPQDGRPACLEMTLPGTTTLVFRLQTHRPAKKATAAEAEAELQPAKPTPQSTAAEPLEVA